MSAPHSLPFRQIHLDFHTSPKIGDVGREFDAAEFARILKRAHVNSINLFAKCHHGHLYYNTARPERHPALPAGLDLLGEQIEACRREGIKTPIYISVQCDEYAANTHPEWIAREKDGRQCGAGPLQPGWQILDMSSPYQDYVAEQTAEILAQFQPVDGIWFDMCWDQPSSNRYAIAGMERNGLNPEDDADRQRYAHLVAQQYMARYYDLVKASTPDALVFFNCRPFKFLDEEIGWFEQIEIEALPTGGWGYMYFPKNVRLIRRCGKPYLGMTARFHKCWADFGGLKPYPALEYETAQMLAHGAQCCIGDQLHPRGILDPAAYELIGQVYARVEAREPWCEGATAVTEIGVLQCPETAGVDEGTTRMLTQLKQQFDLLYRTDDFTPYALLVLPDAIEVDEALRAKLEAYLAHGGKILASGTSGLTADGIGVTLPALGVVPQGMSPFTATYIRFGQQVAEDVPPSDHVMYERGVRVTAAEGASMVAGIVVPYFERAWNHFSSHFQTPADALSPYAAAVTTAQTAYVAYPIFGAFSKHGNAPYRLLVRNLLALLLPRPLLRVEAPTSTEATITQQGERTIIHLLHYTPERRGENLDLVEDIVPLYQVHLALRRDVKPTRVYLAPEGTDVPFTLTDGYLQMSVPEVRGHAMVVVE